VERSLALMCGAGGLPALVAERARAQGWRVVAFAFNGSTGVAAGADRVIPSRVTELGPVLAALQAEGAAAAVFCGRFSMTEILRTPADTADAVSQGVAERAGARIDARLADAVIATLAGVGVSVLDQREFLGDLLAAPGRLAGREPTGAGWAAVRQGLRLARMLADAGIGQTVVMHHGAVTAVEAVEGTTAAIRRGTALGGPGAVIVKAVARAHDYRFDSPAVGLETVQAAADGGAAVLALEAGRVLLLDADAARRQADTAGLALVSVDEPR
jgi:DUF1009 family protein